MGSAVEFIRELRAAARNHPWLARNLPSALRILVAAGDVGQANVFSTGLTVEATRDRLCLLTGKAILAEADEDYEYGKNIYADNPAGWADCGFLLEEGQAHLGLARCLIALGDREAATRPLQEARAIFFKLGHHLGQTTAIGS
jgi:hypothetical protein